MSSTHFRQFSSINNENPIKNIKNNLLTNRKQSALKVLTNTVQSVKKSDCKVSKPDNSLKILPMKKFETEIQSPSQDMIYNEIDEFDHFDCIPLEKDFLPPSMTCNIEMLSNFFNTKNDDNSDWFLEDYDNKIKKTFEDFGELDIEHPPALPPMPIMDFPEFIF